jgi:hypothetical protein
MRTLKGPPIRHSELLGQICQFINAEVIVEIGVQHAKTFSELVQAAKKIGGMVYGYDYLAPIGGYTGEHAASAGDAKIIASALRGYEEYFKITRVDTQSSEFPEILKNDVSSRHHNEEHIFPRIDFAFIDGDHSYRGCRKDFETIYPLLGDDGIIAFHDTHTHIGLRKFVIDLYEDLNDGTFDIINLPFGHQEQRDGLTLLSKRSYPNTNKGITVSTHDPEMVDKDVYKLENSWYDSELNKRKNL